MRGCSSGLEVGFRWRRRGGGRSCVVRPPRGADVTSVCVEQLGTGVVLPTRSEWGWLGITITPEGDVYVADTDQSCLHLV